MHVPYKPAVNMKTLNFAVQLSSCVVLLALFPDCCETSFMDDIKTSVNLTSVVSTYKFLFVDASADWTLKPYAKIAESSLGNLKKEAPHDLIKEIIKLAKGASSSSFNNVKEAFMAYNKPYLALAVISFVFAVVLATIGVLYCCLSHQGNCNLLPKKANPAITRSKARFVYIGCLGICAIFFIMSGGITLLGRQRFKKGITLSRSLTDNTLKNLLEFQNKTFTDLKFILVTQLDKTCDDLIENIHSFSRKVIDATREDTPSTGSTRSLVTLDNELPELNSSFNQLFNELVDAQKLYKDDLIALESRIKEINVNLSITKDLCEQNITLNSSGICQSPEFDPKMSLLVNVSEIPTVSNAFSISLARLVQQNLTDLANKINATVHIYQETIYEKTTLRRADLERIANTIKKHRDSAFQNVEDVLLHKFNELILSKDEQALAKFEDDGLIGKNVNIVTSIMAAISSLELIVGLLLIGSILIGIPVMVFVANENFKGFLPKAAYGMTSSVLHQLFVYSLPMVTILGIMVAICGCLTQTCIGLRNDSILRSVGDDVDTWGGRLLGLTKVVPKIPEHVSLIEVVNICGQSENATVWHAARINEALNIRKKLKLDQLEDPIKFFGLESLFDVGGAIKNFFPLKESAENLTKGLEALNSTIGYTGVLVNGNLTEYGANLTAFSEELENHDIELGRIFGSWGRKATNIANGAADKARDTRDKVKKTAGDVLQKGKDAVTKVKNAIESGKSAEELVNEVKEKFVNGTRKALRVVDQFISHVEKQLNEKIGKCEFINEAYVTGRLIYCSYVVSGLNVVWLSLGVTTFMFTLFMLCFMKSIYYYRLVVLEGMGHFDEINENSPMDTIPKNESNLTAASVEIEDINLRTEVNN